MKSFVTSGTTLIIFLFSNISQAISFTEIIYTPSGNTSTVSQALAVSDDGSTVSGFGGEITGDFSQKSIEAFNWKAGTSTGIINGDINLFPNSTGRGVSSDGSFIVGGKQDLNNPLQEAFRQSSSTIEDLGFLPTHTNSVANDVSNDGSVVVGSSLLSSIPRAFRWVDGTPAVMTDLGVLSGDSSSVAESVSADGSVVVGTSSGTVDQAFRWISSVMTGLGDLPGGTTSSQAFGVSGDGQVVVGDSASANGTEAFRWTSSALTGLGDLAGGAFASSAKATSQDGSIVIGKGTTASGSEAFIWDVVNGMRNLKDLLVANGINMTGWTLSEATGISGDGKSIVGYGTNPDGNATGWIVDLLPKVLLDGDFDGESSGSRKTDILWRNIATGVNWIHLMDGTTLATSAFMSQVGSEWILAAIGDFNGDGKDDVLFRNKTTGLAWMHLLNGTSIIGSSPLTTLNLSWVLAGVGDFNGDGKDDVLWRNRLTGLTWMHLLNGSSILPSGSAPVTTLDSTHWDLIAVGDYDGDSKDDLLWRNKITGLNWMHLLNGSNITGSAALTTLDSNWKLAAVGDFNNDGKDDVLWRNTSSGINWMHLLNGSNILPGGSAGLVTLSNPAWTIAQSGDFDGDGISDLLLRNTDNGRNWMYLLNGASIATSQEISPLTNLDYRANGQ